MEHKYLIYTIFFTIIVGIILSLIGNNMLKQISYDTNIVSCNPDVLEQLSSDNSPNSNAFILNFTGNIFILCGIVFLLLISSVFIIHFQDDTIENIKNIIFRSLPIIFSFIIISYIISLYNQFKENILLGRVPNEFFSYSFLFYILFFVQIGILLNYFSVLANKDTGINFLNYQAIIYVLTFLNLIILGIINIILKFFSTDG